MPNIVAQPDNEEPLTPNHFLIHLTFNSLPTGQIVNERPASMEIWKNTKKLMNHVWRRLMKKFLHAFYKKSKWSDSNDQLLKIDDIV